MIDPVFCQLYIPVAELVPYKVVYFLHRNPQLVFVHVLSHIFCKRIDSGQNPAVSRLQQSVFRLLYLVLFHIHQNKTGRIPYFICKIPACFYPFIIETHIISRRISGYKRKPQRIRAVLVNDLQRINSVAQRFAHLASL